MSTPILLRTYTSITTERFAALDTEAAELIGHNLDGNSGQSAAHGVSIAWNYDPATLTLTFTLIGKPFYVPVSVITDNLDQLVSSAVATAFVNRQATAPSVPEPAPEPAPPEVA